MARKAAILLGGLGVWLLAGCDEPGGSCRPNTFQCFDFERRLGACSLDATWTGYHCDQQCSALLGPRQEPYRCDYSLQYQHYACICSDKVHWRPGYKLPAKLQDAKGSDTVK